MEDLLDPDVPAPPSAAPTDTTGDAGTMDPGEAPPGSEDLLPEPTEVSAVPGESETVAMSPDPTTVQGQLETLFANENPLMQQAEQDARQYAASRGMLNSTLAAQAGREAHYAAALPIAQQDASQAFQSAFSEQQHEQSMELQDLVGTQALEQIEAQGTVQSQLQAEQFEYNTQLSDQQHVQELEQIAATGDVNSMLQNEAFVQQQELLATELANALELSEQGQAELIEQLNLQHTQNLEAIAANVDASAAANLQAQYLAGVTNRQLQTSQEITTIYQTEGLTPAQQQEAVRSAQARLEADLALLADYYAQSPYWDPSWGMTTAVDPITGEPVPGPAPPPEYPDSYEGGQPPQPEPYPPVYNPNPGYLP